MWRFLKDWGVSLAVGVGVFFAVQWSSAPKSSGEAPDFQLVNVAGGVEALSAHEGKVVVLNFWGSWCPPCRAEIPEFAEWHAQNPDIPLIGIAVRSGTAEQVAEKAKILGVNYTVLVGDDQVIDDYNISVYPTTVIVRPDGTIGSVTSGSMGRRELDAAVRQVQQGG
jgi:cytochrome c biogenesis protein CcmG, thiol:disulfide interchange protein DsbE